MSDKEQWILNYIRVHDAVDMLNSEFVDAYIDKFNPKVSYTNFGANKVTELSRILSSLYKTGLLKRSAVGLSGLCGIGFPKWVYVYSAY